MLQPFDFQVLIAKLKAKGLDNAEELVKTMAEATFEWVDQSLMAHPSPYMKFLMPVVATIKPLAMAEIDKIDGKVG